MNDKEERYVTISTTYLRSTEKAIQIDTPNKKLWIPRSCIHYTSDKEAETWREGDEVEIQVMAWLAEQHDL